MICLKTRPVAKGLLFRNSELFPCPPPLPTSQMMTQLLVVSD